MSANYQRGDSKPVSCPIADATAVNVGDLLATDATTGVGYKASAQTWDTDLATTRAAFVTRFLGAAQQFKDAGVPVKGNAGAAPGTVRTHTAGVHTFVSPKAGTYQIGKYVGPAKDTGNALLDQTLEIVGSLAQAIGVVAGRPGVNPSEIEVELLSGILPASR